MNLDLYDQIGEVPPFEVPNTARNSNAHESMKKYPLIIVIFMFFSMSISNHEGHQYCCLVNEFKPLNVAETSKWWAFLIEFKLHGQVMFIL